ncbi:MAG: M81 family metallopeptidase, partial [Pirellulaceae bacterium]|nr:M81 family metallopeptidase [Pirellulaceae bacterium]
MKQQRIGIVQVWQESNDLNPVATTIDDFKSFGFGVGSDGLRAFAAGEEVGGFVDGLKAWSEPADPVGLFMAQAWPGGPLSRPTQQWILDEVQRQLEQAGTLDGLLISLHGALVGDDNIDMDGCLLKCIRDVVG